MQSQQIITVMIGRKTYEKVCTCINGIWMPLPQTQMKVKFVESLEERYPDTYTEEMQERAIKLQAAKKIKQQNKKIDFYRDLLSKIIAYSEYKPKYIQGLKFVCEWLDNNSDKKEEKVKLKLKKEYVQ